MVKRFRLPPPVHGRRSSDRSSKVLDGALASTEDLRNGLVEAGITDVYLSVHRRWMAYVNRKLSLLTNGDERNDEGPHSHGQGTDRASLLCEWIALLYIGKRLGTFSLLLEDHDGERFDGTALTISSTLTQLADTIGRRAAEAIFRRLEAETNRVLDARSDR